MRAAFLCFMILTNCCCMAAEVHILATYLCSYSYAEGLHDSTHYDIHANPSGHLFLGKEVGFVKFNGKSFTLISAPQGP